MLQALRSYLIALMFPLLFAAGLALGQSVLPTSTLTVQGAEKQTGAAWDSGTIEVDFNGFVEIVNYAQYSTRESLASALAAMFVRDYHSFGLYAKAGVNSSQQNVVTFQLVDGSGFGPLNVVDPSASFSLAGSGFAASSATTADIGMATLTINGITVATSNYGSGSTAASIAQDLASIATSNPANTVPVTVTSEGPNVYLQVKQSTGSYSYSYSLTFSTSQSFSTSTPSSGTLNGSTDVAPITVYSYCVGPVNPCPSSGGTSGYEPNGNVQTLNDSVMGSWTYGYDNLNRLTSGTASGGPYNGGFTCWSYDSFGNRTSQSVSTTPCTSNPPATFAATYSANNQISSVTAPSSTTIAYDASGNVTNDGMNTYTYDAEGRVCALNGPQGMIGYQYDANGNRVGKGTVTTIATCDITANGYQPMTDFVLDQSGGQMTEMAIYTTSAGTQYQHVHSNVSAGGALIASFDSLYNPHFYLTDALGSRRVQTDAAGIPEQTCQSLPFGDQLLCNGGSLSTPTEHHFTGKERDAESGLDYFGARYYASNMGRFSSPDPSGLAYADPTNPQSLNLYSYALNNPLKNTDPTGLYCYYGSTDADVTDDSQYDMHSTQSECTAVDENGNQGQWIDDPSASVDVNATTGDTDISVTGTSFDGTLSTTSTQNFHITGCPAVPTAPPGVSVDENMQIARLSYLFQPPPFNQLWFRKMVDYGGVWDYKTQNTPTANYENFGNFNYGATGIEAGAPPFTLRRMAGRAQRGHPASPQFGGDPGSLPSIIANPYGGTPPYGDDPNDQTQINLGIKYAQLGCHGG